MKILKCYAVANVWNNERSKSNEKKRSSEIQFNKNAYDTHAVRERHAYKCCCRCCYCACCWCCYVILFFSSFFKSHPFNLIRMALGIRNARSDDRKTIAQSLCSCFRSIASQCLWNVCSFVSCLCLVFDSSNRCVRIRCGSLLSYVNSSRDL